MLRHGENCDCCQRPGHIRLYSALLVATAWAGFGMGAREKNLTVFVPDGDGLVNDLMLMPITY